MGLEKVTNIEGFDGFTASDMPNDTNPGVTQVRFFVKAEEMPFESAQKGEIVRRNFVWIEKVINLGNLIVTRRIVDNVEFVDGSWKVKKVAEGKYSDGNPVSDILRYPDEWNHFARSAKEEEFGTPIITMFKNDPSRAEWYKAHYIKTVEQLAACSQTHIDTLGLGAREDVAKAKAHLDKLRNLSPSIAIEAKLAEKDSQINTLSSQVADLTAKLTTLLESKIENFQQPDAPIAKPKRGRPPINREKTVTETENITL